MFKTYKYYILLHLIIFMWGFTGILGKLIALDAFIIVWHRVLIAFIALGLFLLFRKKSILISNWQSGLKLIGVGIIVTLHWITFYKSIQLSTASLGILCLSTTTLHVTWLEPFVMKRPFQVSEFLLGFIVIFGIYFVSSDFQPHEYAALGYGLISALCAALFSVFNAKLAQEIPTPTITLYEMGTGFIFLSIILLFQGKLTSDLFIMTTSDFLWLLFLGILCTSFAFLITIEIVKVLGAFTVSLSINLEPIYTILLAIFILQEHTLLNNRFYIGATLIILVVIANGWMKNYQRRLKLKNLS
ncbi:MAG: DMT family transporter [Crocinitomicaceae bacterium]|nr:DMT family transporter [Crocinitomicaceae bacterium]